MNSYEKALKLLGLNANYTEEELKKVKWRLSKQYHPDLMAGKSEEEIEAANRKMKEINDAVDLLDKRLKKSKTSREYKYNNNNRNNNYSYNTDNVKAYKEQIIKKIKSYIKTENIEDVNDYILSEMLKSSQKLIADYIDNINNCYDAESTIDQIYSDFKKAIKGNYLYYESKFYEMNGIDKGEVEKELIYDCSVEDFYDQLLDIKKKYNKKADSIKNEIRDTYKLYQGYDKVKDLIEEVLSTIENKLKNSSLEKVKKEIKKYIDSIFETYFRIINLKSNLENTLNDMLGNSVKGSTDWYKIIGFLNDVNSIKTEFFNVNDLFNTLNNLENLETNINRYREMQEKELLIGGLYVTVLNKYNKALSELSVLNDLDSIKKVNKIFTIFLGKIEAYKNGEIDIDKILSLDSLTFRYFEADYELLNGKKEVYIKYKTDYMFERNFCYKEFDGEKEYMISFSDSVVRKFANFNVKNYVTLDEFLNKGSFLGRKAEMLGREIIGLYKYNGYVLVLDNYYGSFDLYSESIIEISDETVEEAIPYSNKEYMKLEIIRYMDESISKIEEEQAKKQGDSTRKRKGKIF